MTITKYLFLFLPLALGAATYDVKGGYGAVGDDSTNDTTSIQNAINAAHSAGSGTVYFPASSGCYMVSGLTIYSGITYSGASQSVCIKQISGSSSSVMTGTNSSTPLQNATISYLTLDGNSVSYASNRSCLYLYSPTNVAINNVTIQHCQEDGIYKTGTGTNMATQGDGLLITNVTSTQNGRNGYSVIVGKNIVVRDSAFTWNSTSAPADGVDLEPNNSSQLIQNFTCERCDFSNNGRTTGSNTRAGFNVWSAFASQPNLNVKLIDCTFTGNGGDAIYAAGSGNTITGITILGGSASGNLGLTPWRAGIDVWNAANLVINGLSVSATASGSYGLYTNGVAGVYIANATLAGASYDLSINGGSNANLYSSSTLTHGTHQGTYSAPSGTAPTITTTSLAAGSTGTSYNQTLTATGDATISWTSTWGTLPTGLSLSTGGAITGTPTVVGLYTFTVHAANSVTYDEQTFSINVTSGGGGGGGTGCAVVFIQ